MQAFCSTSGSPTNILGFLILSLKCPSLPDRWYLSTTCVPPTSPTMSFYMVSSCPLARCALPLHSPLGSSSYLPCCTLQLLPCCTLQLLPYCALQLLPCGALQPACPTVHYSPPALRCFLQTLIKVVLVLPLNPLWNSLIYETKTPKAEPDFHVIAEDEWGFVAKPENWQRSMAGPGLSVTVGWHMHIHQKLQKRPSATRHCPVIFKSFMGKKHSRLCAFPTVPPEQDYLNVFHPLFCANILFPVKSYSFFLATSIQNYFKSSVAYFTEKSKVYSGPDRQPESTMPMEKSTKQRSEGRRPAVKIRRVFSFERKWLLSNSWH